MTVASFATITNVTLNFVCPVSPLLPFIKPLFLQGLLVCMFLKNAEIMEA